MSKRGITLGPIPGPDSKQSMSNKSTPHRDQIYSKFNLDDLNIVEEDTNYHL